MRHLTFSFLWFATPAFALCSIGLSATSNAQPWQASGNLVLSYQQADAPSVANETSASGDLVFTQQSGVHGWLAHFEMSSAPADNGVSTLLPEANGNVGTALGADHRGRLQLSELYYQFQLDTDALLSVGMLDISGFFEQSRIASDETTQFLASTFTGNPSIEFPDYSLGLVYEHQAPWGSVMRFGMASSHGLADNPQRSYSQLLSVEDDEKGLFAIASMSWEREAWLLRFGTWMNSAQHQSLADIEQSQKNYGAYLLSGYQQGHHGFSLRLGWANPAVSRASEFVSFAYNLSHGDWLFGAAIGRAFASSHLSGTDLAHSSHLELFARLQLRQGLYITADMQWISNSDLGQLAAYRQQQVRVSGLRLTWLFE